MSESDLNRSADADPTRSADDHDPYEKALAAWRRDARARELPRETVEELEAHLRESVDALVRDGAAARLTPVEALGVARARLGELDGLREEFVAADRGAVWRGRLQWMVTGGLAFAAVPILASTAGWLAVLVGRTLGAGDTVLPMLYVLADVNVLALALLVVVAVVRGNAGGVVDRLDRAAALARRLLSSPGGVVLACAGLVAVVLVQRLTYLLALPTLTARLDAGGVGRLLTTRGWIDFVQLVAVPLVAVALLVALRRKDDRERRALVAE